MTQSLTKAAKPPATSNAMASTWRAATNAFKEAEYPLEIPADGQAIPSFLNFFLRTRPITHSGSVHHRFVLLLNLGTSGVIMADDAWIDLREGEAFLIFPYQYHDFCNFAGNHLQWLFLTFELSQPESLQPLRNHVLTLTAEVMGDTERLCRLCHEHPRPVSVVRHQMALLSGLILHGLLRLPAQAIAPARENKEAAHDLVERVGRYMRQHIGQGFTIRQLAEQMALSESHLRHSFRSATGTSLGQYLRQMRMLQAMSLLHTTSLNVSQIAERCGFSSLFAFSRSFRQHTGVSPMAYRRYHKRS